MHNNNQSSIVLAMAMAMDKNKLIGKDGGLPWHIPGELAHFKSVTMGKPIVMGRKTFDSIGKPLPGRTNIVVTRNKDWRAGGVVACESLSSAIQQATAVLKDESGEIVVIGGAALCREAMPITERLYLTYIDHAYEGDTWLDSFDFTDWAEADRVDNEHDGLRFSYLTLERRTT